MRSGRPEPLCQLPVEDAQQRRCSGHRWARSQSPTWVPRHLACVGHGRVSVPHPVSGPLSLFRLPHSPSDSSGVEVRRNSFREEHNPR